MAHPFLVKDIAFQAGVSTATVDRVLNDRAGVRLQTIAREGGDPRA
ncbi:DNA-binding LacI/PurR family transcriptional regulator [Ensifer mexicanus]|nr:DNA-binding LacI/PurR family transcriptional regulator [Sinorhizobium mexicanum]